MGQMTDDELRAAQEAKARKRGGAPSTRRADAAKVAEGLIVPRPTVVDLRRLVEELDEEAGGEAEADEVAASVVVALRARGWSFQRIAERMRQPLDRVVAWMANAIDKDAVMEVEGFLDKFVLPAAADVAHAAILEGDRSMAKEVLRGRGPLRKVLKEPGPKGSHGTITPSGPPVLNLQINVLPGTPGAEVAVGAVSGTPRVMPPSTAPSLAGNSEGE